MPAVSRRAARKPGAPEIGASGDDQHRSDCTAMRREVMTIINERPGPLGWRLRIERAIALGLRPSYGMAAVLLAGIVSVSVLAQIRPTTPGRFSPFVLEGSDTLLRPDGYRHWTLVSGAGAADAARQWTPVARPRLYQPVELSGVRENGNIPRRAPCWSGSRSGGGVPRAAARTRPRPASWRPSRTARGSRAVGASLISAAPVGHLQRRPAHSRSRGAAGPVTATVKNDLVLSMG